MALTAVLLLTETRVLVVYAIGAAFFGILVAVAVKIALIQRWIEQTLTDRKAAEHAEAAANETAVPVGKSDQLV